MGMLDFVKLTSTNASLKVLSFAFAAIMFILAAGALGLLNTSAITIGMEAVILLAGATILTLETFFEGTFKIELTSVLNILTIIGAFVLGISTLGGIAVGDILVTSKFIVYLALGLFLLIEMVKIK